MYKHWDLEVWDIIYAKLRDSDNESYIEWEWKIENIFNEWEYKYPIYIKWLNRSWSTNIKYSEVTRVIEYKKQEEIIKKPFYFIRC